MEVIEVGKLLEKFIIENEDLVEKIRETNLNGDVNIINEEYEKFSKGISPKNVTFLWIYLCSSEERLNKFGILSGETCKGFKARYVACEILKSIGEYTFV